MGLNNPIGTLNQYRNATASAPPSSVDAGYSQVASYK